MNETTTKPEAQTNDVENPVKQKCGIIMPISSIGDCHESHWKDVLNIISEAVDNAGLEAKLVSNADDVGVIQKRIVQNIYNNEIVVCDMSCKNPNVMFELGMRLAFDKPAVIIMDDETSYSFDTSIIEHISYPRDLHYQSIIAFKEELTKKIISTLKESKNPEYSTFLKNFGNFNIANISQSEVSKDTYLVNVVTDLSEQIERLDRKISDFSASQKRIPKYVDNNYIDYISTYDKPLTAADSEDLLNRLRRVGVTFNETINPRCKNKL